MKYTALYGHLESESSLGIGQDVFSGTEIGVMGSSGKSTADHLHFGLIKGVYPNLFRMGDIVTDQDLLTQASYFIDNEMFGIDPVITSFWGDPRYTNNGRFLFHAGYDVVPVDRKKTKDHYAIKWNRTKAGMVLNKGFDAPGYGYYVLIDYEV